MIKTTIKDLKKGDFFTLKPIEQPIENQVYIKQEYDKSDKKYTCVCFGDICKFKALKPNTIIYTDFIF